MTTFSRTGAVVLCAIALELSACAGTHHGKIAAAQTSPRKTASSALAAGSGLPDEVVVRVGRNLITRQALAHWMRVEADLQSPGTPAPGQDAALREETLEILILHYWVKEEATNAGVAVSARELNRVLKRAFPTAAKPPVSGGLRASDEAFVLDDDLLLEKWRRTTLPVYARLRRSKGPESAETVGEVHSEIAKLTARMTDRWTPRTQCRAGYLIALCSDYHR